MKITSIRTIEEKAVEKTVAVNTKSQMIAELLKP